MDIRRVALIFDDVQRPETTGVYCRRALSKLVEVEHFRPGELERIPRAGFDLYLNIDDGLRYHLPPDLHPRAWWAIDTHLDFAWCLEKSRGFDVVFAAQRDGAEQLRRMGIASAVWLPLGCDPEVHGKHDVPKQYDVAFVGNIFPGPRSELLELIRRRYPQSFIGQCCFEEMARTYSAARTAFNRSIKNDVNMRVFEALASGSLLVTNDLGENGQAELFRDGVHLATYRQPEELLDKIKFYLDRQDVREQIAAAGRAEVLDKHTYSHRMQHLLTEAEQALARVVVQPAVLPFEPLPDSGQAPRSAALPVPSGSRLSSANGPDGHDPFYFGHARPEVLALVPETARMVLDIGCGEGRLGEALKRRQPAQVVGIELNETAAATARGLLDQVRTGDVEKLDPPFPAGSFDAVVCGDILEHLREPGRLLRQARGWLAPEGRLIASIPNIRHHSVVRSVLQGNWTYESAGLLDQDHVRFFTRREIEKLFFRAGFAVELMSSVIGPGDRDTGRNGSGPVQLGRLSIAGLSDRDAAEFYTYQYLIRARPVEIPDFGLTSIVIVTHNQLDYTRQCLDSIRRLTDEPYELIVVDNGSSDGTVEYLSALSYVRLIVNDANRGFPAAVNQGIAVSGGSQVLLLNNDVVVATGWLCRLLRAMRADPAIGLAGPCSNFVSGPQQVDVGYDSLTELDGFAWDWGGAHDGVRIDVSRLVGFCLLIRRAVVDAIGLFDEQFGIGCFEDDDYCLRAIQAGYRAVIAADAFVHHFGGRTFVGNGIDTGALLRENERRFRAKWSSNGVGTAGAPPAVAADPPPPRQRPGPFACDVAPGGGLRLRIDLARPRLSLCMIVRDSAKTLPAALESIRPWVDEMVIVDTGSVDETPRIVEEFGGRLFRFAWCDDFSAARNESVRHARGDWVFWMDSDDTIQPECGRGIRGLTEGEVDPKVLGFIMQVHCPGVGEDGEFDVEHVDHVKLFRNRPDLRFDGRIHEQILGAISGAGGRVAWTNLHVVHSGSDQSPEGQEKKRQRDLRMLQLELAERPEHPFTLFNLGMTYNHWSQFAEAVDYLRRGIAQALPTDLHLRKVYALLSGAELRLGRAEEALATCRRGRGLFPLDTELLFREGVVLHALGRLDEARQAYQGALTDREERHFASVDRALSGFKARHNLALVLADMGDLAEAERQWREVVREVPRYRPGWRGLGEILLRGGRFAEVEALAEALLSDGALRIEGLLMKSRTALAQKRFAEARADLDRAVAERPDDLETLRGRGQFFLEHGAPDEAERAFKSLIERDPRDASAHHNLGTLLLATQRYDEAVQEYRQALRYRPNHAATYLQLGYALKESGRHSEAVPAWEHVLRLAPGDPSARRELIRARGA
ncbi:MAG: glycosyltransferase [Isosphaerales bacterium]